MGLVDEVELLRAENAELKAKLAALEVELERLRRELGRNSKNSGKPPSSDTLAERANQVEERLSRAERRRMAREKAKKFMKERVRRQPGKQPGAAGVTLSPAEQPDHVVVHAPGTCRRCGESLGAAEVVGTQGRQVFDLPLRRLEVTEHRAEARRCRCGAVTKGEFPKAATAPTCYGPLVRATALYLMVGQHLPVARTAAVMSQICGAAVSTGWLAGLGAEAAEDLSPFLEELRCQLVATDVLGADETGARISGARYWFHVACNDLLTLLDCHPRRGIEALEDIAVLPLFAGVVISDGWKPYWSVAGVEHALCCAHILRDLASLTSSVAHRPWADAMADLLVEAKRAVEAALAAGRSGLSDRELRVLVASYNKLINTGVAALPARHHPGTAHHDAYLLLRRLRDQRDEVTRYWRDPRVSFDNNQAERDLRMVKLQQKVSGCFRTLSGAKAFCAVRSYLQTAQKHGLQGLEVLVALFSGEPWLPPKAASSP